MIRTNTSLPEIAAALREAESIAVLSHARPDGDAIGSGLAVALPLRALGKQVVVLNEDGVPGTLAFLPGASTVVRPDRGTPVKADLAVAVDCANRERLGAGCLEVLSAVPRWINIDHHRSNEDYGDLFYVDPSAPATGEIIHALLTEGGFPLDVSTGENLYAAISTDTGSFQYCGTTARTYETAAALIRLGVDVPGICRNLYEAYPLRRIELLRRLLNDLQVTHGGRVASWGLTRAMIQETGALPEDAEGLIDTIRAIRGVVVAIALEELPDGRIRVSLRSKDPSVDVGHLAARFGGGGHPLAAGARLPGPLSDARSTLFHALNQTFPGSGN